MTWFAESSDEGISADFEDINEIKREMIDLRCQLDRERHLRMMLQKQNQSLHLKQEHQTTVQDIPEKRPKDKVVCIFFFWNGDKSWELTKRYLKCLLFHLLRTFFFFYFAGFRGTGRIWGGWKNAGKEFRFWIYVTQKFGDNCGSNQTPGRRPFRV